MDFAAVLLKRAEWARNTPKKLNCLKGLKMAKTGIEVSPLFRR
jgi:hypothetical protein